MGRKRKNKKREVPKSKPIPIPEIVVKEFGQVAKNIPMKLRFSPTAWTKLLYLRDIGNTEVGGFALTYENDPLYVSDFIIPKQSCGSVSVEFDDDSIADMTDDLVDLGYQPKQFMRIWIHTHPSMSASPSTTDDDTFDRVFGGCDWAIMFIISKTEDVSCRLRVNGGPFPGDFEIPVEVDYTSYNFEGSDFEAWEDEYNEKITQVSYAGVGFNHMNYIGNWDQDDWKNRFGTDCGNDYINTNDDAISLPANSKLESVIPTSSEYDISNFGKDEISIQSNTAHLNIPEELLNIMDANELIELEMMNRYEREYVIKELQSKYGF